MQRSLASALMSGFVTLITFGAIGTVLWFGGNEVLKGNLSGGELSAFLFYAVLVAGSVGSLSDIVGQLLRGAGASERLMELLVTEPGIKPPERPEAAAGAPLPARCRPGARLQLSGAPGTMALGRRLTSPPASGSRWWGRPAPASRRCSICCCASTTRSRVA
jgi:ATP-binding cassette subfamily B protein